MRDFNEKNATAAVIERMSGATDARFKQIMTSIVTHLHAVVREVEPTMEEWMTAIQFLTATGKKCDDKRQEFILLSDTLGVSMLVDAINHRKPGGATETTVLGPFYVSGAKDMPMWADIAGDAPGEPAYISGRVLDVGGKPIAGAMLDVFEQEPLPAAHPFWRHSKVIVTPHVAAPTLASESEAQVVENIRRLERGDPPLGLVDRKKGY